MLEGDAPYAVLAASRWLCTSSVHSSEGNRKIPAAGCMRIKSEATANVWNVKAAFKHLRRTATSQQKETEKNIQAPTHRVRIEQSSTSIYPKMMQHSLLQAERFSTQRTECGLHNRAPNQPPVRSSNDQAALCRLRK